MKRLLLELSERLRVDLLDLRTAIEAEDVDAAISVIGDISGRIDAATAELRA